MDRWDDEDLGAWRPVAAQYRRALYRPLLDDGIGGGACREQRTLATTKMRPATARALNTPARRRAMLTTFPKLRKDGPRLTHHLAPRRRASEQFGNSSAGDAAALATESESHISAENGGNTVTNSAESDSNGSKTLETSIGAPTLPQPSNSNENIVDGVAVGTADTIGRRSTMEDEMIVARHITAQYHRRIWLFGVLDGHGGAEASKFAATNWPRLLFSLLDSAGSCQARKVRLAIETSIDQCNDMLYRHLMNSAHDLNVGTTLCAVIIVDGKDLYCVNVGDSRAIALNRDGKLIGSLSKDHKPARPDETRRIVALGGHVTNYDGVPRVMGNLAVSRALGDFPSTPYVTHRPDIVGPRQMRQVSTIVVCCDGVTDVLDNDNIAEIVGDRVHRLGAQSAAEAVRNSAYSHYSGDNISVLVAKIN